MPTLTGFRITMRLVLSSFVLASLLAPCALAAAPESRSVSEPERKAFFDFYRALRPEAHGEQPVFVVRRAGPAAQWSMSAHVDSPPARGLRSLCRMQRSAFRHDGRWQEDGPPRQYAWVDKRSCRAPAQPVRLLFPMPDADVLGLLENQHALLKSARLLFGGNTFCARQRAYIFTLSAIDIGTSGSSSEVLAGLQFKDDRQGSATVWVRRTGLAYDAWNVSCP